MTKIIQQSSRGGICEQFVYPPNLAVYPNYSDMNELSEIALCPNKKRKVKNA